MPSIQMYLDGADVDFLNDWLNQEEEIAFLTSNGRKHWIAKKEHSISDDLRNILEKFGYFGFPFDYELWHVPSGPLPLIKPNNGVVSLRMKEEDWKYKDFISNPWLGWKEETEGSNPRIPYFESHPGVLQVTITPTQQWGISTSYFGWIGNHYSIIGNKANPLTEKFWKRLYQMVRKVSTQIPRGNNKLGKKMIYAFPNALIEINNGKPCR
jgi:hypothetical protein